VQTVLAVFWAVVAVVAIVMAIRWASDDDDWMP